MTNHSHDNENSRRDSFLTPRPYAQAGIELQRLYTNHHVAVEKNIKVPQPSRKYAVHHEVEYEAPVGLNGEEFKTKINDVLRLQNQKELSEGDMQKIRLGIVPPPLEFMQAVRTYFEIDKKDKSQYGKDEVNYVGFIAASFLLPDEKKGLSPNNQRAEEKRYKEGSALIDEAHNILLSRKQNLVGLVQSKSEAEDIDRALGRIELLKSDLSKNGHSSAARKLSTTLNSGREL